MKLEAAVLSKKKLSQKERELAITHTGNILGRTFEEIVEVYDQFSTAKRPDHFLHLIYWLGKRAMEEIIDNSKRSINFSPVLRERLGHHIYGEAWANTIKETLQKHNLIDRPIHIISANLHSVLNTLHAPKALKTLCAKHEIFSVYELLGQEKNEVLRNKVKQTALQEGMIFIKDSSGTNIDVQIFDASKIEGKSIHIRQAKEGEKITTLDGAERVLDSNMMVIADCQKALVIAGIMGSIDAEVDGSTVDIILEAAWFKPGNIRSTEFKIPHMGWNQVKIIKDHFIFKGFNEPKNYEFINVSNWFYFVHSFFVIPDDPKITLAQTNYGISFASVVAKDNIVATQFHPEKSAKSGLLFLENFISWKL